MLEKPFAPDELRLRIQQALELDRRRPSEQVRRAELSEKFAELTARDSQVLQLVIAGLANKQMARRLDLSEKTIEGHRSRLMKKIGVKSVAELVRLAMDAGVAPEPNE